MTAGDVRLVGRLWRQLFARHWRRTPRQTALVVVLLAVGVASFLSIRLANRAAVASFQNFTDTLTGQSDWIIQPTAGTFHAAILPELRRLTGSRPVHIVPVIEGVARAGEKGSEGKVLSLLGIDLFALANVVTDDSRLAGSSRGTLWRSLEGTPLAWANERTASDFGKKTIPLGLNGSVRSVALAEPLKDDRGELAFPDNLLVFDLPTLQALLGRTGELDRVEFLVEPGPDRSERSEELHQLLEQSAGGRWLVQSPGARRASAETMTRAFRLNLTVLSLIALLVGLYLIGQTLDGTVVRRRPEIATLRALGVTERWIQLLWLGEAAMLGLFGSALGIALGWVGAQAAVLAVGRTVNALYFATTVSAASLQWQEAIIALALGTLATIAAGAIPARSAAKTPPAHLLSRTAVLPRGSSARPWLFLGAAMLLGAGAILATLPPLRFEGGTRFPLAGYGTALCWIVGGGLLAGELLRLIPRIARRSDRPQRVVAWSQFRRPTMRHRIAIAGLVCATGMTAAMAVLVESFERSVTGWIAQSLKADLYLGASAGASAGPRQRLPQSLLEELRQEPGVLELQPLSIRSIVLKGLRTQLHGGNLLGRIRDGTLVWVERPRDPWPENDSEPPALVSETFANRFGCASGESVLLPTPRGEQPVRIAGVFADYGNEEGSIVVDREQLDRWFGESGATNLALRLEPAVSASQLRARLLERYPGLTIYENAALRGEILRIFHQTFSITYALELIGVIVAVAGLGLTLASMLLDRISEATTLRALGFTRGQLAQTAAFEGVAMAAIASLAGVLLSFALGWLLVYVINRQSFGWTLQFAIPWPALVALIVAVVFVGGIVSFLVGRRASALAADFHES